MKPKKNKKYQLPTTKMFTPKFPGGGIVDPNADPNTNQFRNNSINVVNDQAFNAHQAAIPLAQANTSRLITDASGNRIRVNADGSKQIFDSTGTKLLPTFDNGGLNNLYGTPTNNQYAQNTYYTGNNTNQSDINKNFNTQMGIYGQGSASDAFNQREQQGLKQTQTAQATNKGIDSTVSSALPWYGYAKAGEGIGKSALQYDQYGNPKDNSNSTNLDTRLGSGENRALNTAFTPGHEQAINDFSAGNSGYGVIDILSGGMGKTSASMMGTLFGNKNAFGKESNDFANSGNNPEPTKEDLMTNKGYIQQMGENAKNGISDSSMQLPQARKGGQIDINNTEGLYYNPNTPYQNSNNNAREDMDYKFQQPNAEVEKQENAISPDGTFKQFDGASHEDGGIKTNLPQGAIIFSDKLKPKGSKETFAKLNKVNDTKKEDKIISDKFATKESKATAQLMDSIKNKNSQALFQEQENQKQLEEQKSKEAFANGLYKYGGVVEYKDGGIHIKPSKVGSFTRFAKKHGMGVQEAASHVLAHKESFSSSIVKKANFAHNAAGWKHEEGGMQYYPNGGIQPVIAESTGVVNQTPIQVIPVNNNQGHNRRVQFTNGGIQDANYNYPRSYGQVYKDTHVQQFKGLGIWAKGGVNGFTDEDPNSYAEYQANQPQTVKGFPGLGDDGGDNYISSMFNTGSYAGNINPNKSITQNQTQQPYDWKSAAYQGAGTLAQSAGQLAYLAQQGKQYDKQNFYNYKPTLLDPTAALRDADIQSNAGAYSLKEGSGGNAGNYLANRIALVGENTLNKANIRSQYANANAGISNQGQMYNIGNQYRTDDINAANKGQALTNYYQTLGSLGTNTASGMRDYKADQMDQQKMNMLPYMYTNPEFQKYWASYNK